MDKKQTKKITPRGKTQKFKLNEKFIFGAPRCMKCGKNLKLGEFFTCNNCKSKVGK